MHDADTSNVMGDQSVRSDMHPEDIKAEIRKRGRTPESLAREAGMGGNALRLALTLPRADAERIIADFLKVHPKTIWPSRYGPDGTRKRPQPVDNYRHAPRFGKSA